MCDCNKQEQQAITIPDGYGPGICDVCLLVSKDKSIKKIRHCEFCNANICMKCEKRYDKRILAAIIEKIMIIKKGYSYSDYSYNKY